ncbi:phosphotransferase [Promicromonospora panici]|uniref:phosphotransferase n=1 Tax=Promicromonospora panici TaxID=2219658 RepID=UPI00101CDE3F|nr:phosphotransferase [Promicromonospora panici]
MSALRPGWRDLPPALKERINHLLGARVIAASTPGDSGTLPVAQFQVQTMQGNAFVKALGTEQPDTLNFLRQEIALSPLLPQAAPNPELLWSIDEVLPNLGTWVAVAYAMRADVRPIDLSWPEDDVATLFRVVRSIGEIEAPDDPMFLPEEKVFPADSWEVLADRLPARLANHSPWLAGRLEGLAEIASHAPDAIAGKSLQHGTLRVQNVMLPTAPGAKALISDWIRGSAGAPYLDLVSILLHARINDGPPPEATLRRYGLPPGTEPDAVTCWIAVLAGHYVKSSMEPPPTDMPELRSYQHRLAQAAVSWLKTRLGF